MLMETKARGEKYSSVIEQADEVLLNDILQAIIKRYSILFPDWEVSVFSLPKNNPEERDRLVDTIIKFIKQKISM